MKLNRGIFAVFVSALIALSCLYYVPFFFQQNQVRAEVKTNLAKGKTEQFTFSEQEFAALKFDGDDEFYLNDKLYDIVRTEKVAGKITVFVLSDEKEKELINNFNKLSSSLNGAKKNESSPVKTMGKIISLKYLSTNSTETKPAFVFSFSQSFAEVVSSSPERGYYSSLVNPPDFA